MEPDEFLLFREKLSQIDTLIDTRCCKEILENFTLKELKVYMKRTYEKMLYFLKEPFKYMGKGRIFEKLEIDVTLEHGMILCRYKYKCNNNKNLRSIFVLQFVDNKCKAVFLYTFLEDGDKNNSNGSKSYKKAIEIAINRLNAYKEE